MEHYHLQVVAGCRELAPCDSVVVSEPLQPNGLTTVDVDPSARQLIELCEDEYARFAPDLANALQEGARTGGFIDGEVYSARDRRELPIFCEVVRPQRVQSGLVLTPHWRRRPLGNIRLQRHGGAPFRPSDLEQVLALLPVVELGLVLLRSQASVAGTAEVAGLSTREGEVAHYVACGLTTRQISLLLGTSHHTVRNQIGRIFLKLGVSNRAELAAAVTVRKSSHALSGGRTEFWLARSLIASLGRREEEVAQYISRGLTTAQIASIIGTSPLTVRNQIRRIFDKLGVGSRAQVAELLLSIRGA